LLLFPVAGGLYLNCGELADFFAGWFGADLAADDERGGAEAGDPPRGAGGAAAPTTPAIGGVYRRWSGIPGIAACRGIPRSPIIPPF